jgi:hypothetical protein
MRRLGLSLFSGFGSAESPWAIATAEANDNPRRTVVSDVMGELCTNEVLSRSTEAAIASMRERIADNDEETRRRQIENADLFRSIEALQQELPEA